MRGSGERAPQRDRSVRRVWAARRAGGRVASLGLAGSTVGVGGGKVLSVLVDVLVLIYARSGEQTNAIARVPGLFRWPTDYGPAPRSDDREQGNIRHLLSKLYRRFDGEPPGRASPFTFDMWHWDAPDPPRSPDPPR